jgi:CrcB protein
VNGDARAVAYAVRQTMADGGGPMVWVVIAVGSAIGGVLRQLATELVTHFAGAGFPWGTILVNTTGSLAMGVVAAVAGVGVSAPWSPVLRHAVMTGLLGGFTTFSAFSMQTVSLASRGEWTAAALNVAVSLVVCLVSCWAGYAGVLALAR